MQQNPGSRYGKEIREDILAELEKIEEEDWEAGQHRPFVERVLQEANFDELTLLCALFGRFYFHLLEEDGRLMRIRTVETKRKRRRGNG